MEIFALGAFKRVGRSATAAYTFRVWEVHDISPIAVDRVFNRIEKKLRGHAQSTLFDSKPMPPATEQALRRALRAESSELARAHERLGSILTPAGSRFRGREGDIDAQFKDASSLALDFAGGSRDFLRPGDGTQDDQAPFLSGLDNYRPIEDLSIGHDFNFLAGAQSEPGRPYVLGAAEFRLSETETLTVYNANRGPIEHALGVDLVYYHKQRRSFVMVQYKRMVKTAKEWVYRADANFAPELQRMRRIRTGPPQHQTSEYRLNSSPFYFKFLRNVNYEPYSTDLLPGMYLPLEQIDLLSTLPENRTRQGNFKIGMSVPHMDARAFSGLVRKGLIGSQGSTTQEIEQICTASLNRDRSLLYAVHDAGSDQ